MIVRGRAGASGPGAVNRSAHALAGAAAWLALVTYVVDQPLRLTVAGCVLAVGLAAGQGFSPDLDQR